MRRQIVAFTLAVALVAAACGSDSNDTAAADPASATSSDTDTSTAAGAATTDTPGTDPTVSTPVTDTAAPEPTVAPAEPIDELRIYHPETLAFAAPFALLDPDGPLSEVAMEVTTDVWTTPDVLRSVLVNGQSDVTAVPTYVGANLANRGVEVQLAAVVVWGLLWMIGPDGVDPSWESLRGQTVMIPFQNDMPDLVFRYLAAANGLTPGEDFTIEYYAQPPEVVARLVSGNGTWAVLPEHVATVALAQAGQNGHVLARVLDLQHEWATATGSSARIPQAGVVVPASLAAERPDVIAAVLDELEAAVATVNEAEPDTLARLAEASGVPEPIIAQVIPRLNLDVVPGGAARAELERFYTELATLSPDIIGGRLPDASFYLDDPR